MDLVFIEDLRIETIIGIYDWERTTRQVVALDIEMAFDNTRPAASDRIGDTLDYSALRLRLQRLMTEHGVKLLEALAEQVAHIALDDFGARWVRVRIAKPRKFADTAAVGVMIERRREPAPERPTLTLIGAGLVPGSLVARN